MFWLSNKKNTFQLHSLLPGSDDFSSPNQRLTDEGLVSNPSGICLIIHQDFQTSFSIQLKFHMETPFVSESSGP